MKKMQKVPDFLANLFSRSKQQLESDAVPVPENTDESHVEESVVSVPSSNEFPIAEQSLQPYHQTDVMNSNGFPYPTFGQTQGPNNNVVAINNTQAQNVYQFSNIKNLHIGSVYKINNETSDRPEQEEKRGKNMKTKTIQAMMHSTEPLSHIYLDTISTHLGEGWKDIMRTLKFSDGQIHQAIVDHTIDGGVKEVIYQLLLDWSRNDEEATLGRITEILWRSGHRETVQYMKHCWKSEKTAQNVEGKEI